MNIGAAIKYYRTFLALTQQELGDRTGKSKAMIAYTERTSASSLKVLTSIASGLGIPFAAIVLKATELEDVPVERSLSFRSAKADLMTTMEEAFFPANWKRGVPSKKLGRKSGGTNKPKIKPTKVVKAKPPEKPKKVKVAKERKNKSIKLKRSERDQRELAAIRQVNQAPKAPKAKSYAPRYHQRIDNKPFFKGDEIEFMDFNERLTGFIEFFVEEGKTSPSGKNHGYLVAVVKEKYTGRLYEKAPERFRHVVKAVEETKEDGWKK